MKIIERSHIDSKKWNALVDKTADATFFSYTWYLDATAEQWCALVSGDYTAGIALPYSTRLGIETLYTPIFVRYIEWLGDRSELKKSEALIRERFKNMNISTRQKILGVGYEEYVYQELKATGERRIGSQAKRMLKKAGKNELSIVKSNDFSQVSAVIESELKGKFAGIDSGSLSTLDKLFASAVEADVLQAYTIEGKGGIVCLEKENRTLYLKGTVIPEVKDIGGMYLALNTAIEEALGKEKVFDFGGSRAEGVKRFNHNLGGKDMEYYNYKVDKTPFWFKFARRIRSTWKK